jgi:hypothetical protein
MGCLDPDSESGSGFGIRIRIQGQEKEENEEKIQTFILIFDFLNHFFDFAAHTNTVYLPIFSSAAEPHHIDAAPAPLINFDAAPTLVRILPHCKVC